jgi:hypothetical protein
MVTVRIHPSEEAKTPSAKLIATAHKSADVTTSDGRVVTLKMPNINAEFDLIEALGDSAGNATFMNMNMPLIFVAAIDGDPVATPATEGELRALYARLGDDGNEAAQLGIFDHFIGDAKTKAATEGELKNS